MTGRNPLNLLYMSSDIAREAVFWQPHYFNNKSSKIS